jgi:hypothetical protein
MRRLTVTAPYTPATITQARKNTFAWKPTGSAATSPHTSPAARNPL